MSAAPVLHRAWPLRLRLALWIAIAGCWWLQTASLAERSEACRAEHERVRLIQQVADLETSVRELVTYLPESPAQDRAWWKVRLIEHLHSQRMEVAGMVIETTPVLAGSIRLDKIAFTATGTYAQLLAVQTWLEALRPRVRTVSLTLNPASGGRITAAMTLLVPVQAVTESR